MDNINEEVFQQILNELVKLNKITEDTYDDLKKKGKEFPKNKDLAKLLSEASKDSPKNTETDIEDLLNTNEKQYVTTVALKSEIQKLAKVKGMEAIQKIPGSSMFNETLTVFFSNVERMSPKFLAGIGLAATALIAMTTSLWRNATIMSDLYKSGVAFSGGMQQFTTYSHELGISFEDTTNLMKKYGTSISGFTGLETFKSALHKTSLVVDGSSKSFAQHARSFGMSTSEASEFLADYMEQQRLSGRLNQLSAQQIAYEAKQRLEAVNGWSLALNRSRKDLEEANRQISANPVVEAASIMFSDISSKIGESFNSVKAQFAAFGPEFGNMAAEMVAQPLMQGTDQFVALLGSGGAGIANGFSDLRQMIESGVTDQSVISAQIEKIAEQSKGIDFQTLMLQAQGGNQYAQQMLKNYSMLRQMDAKIKQSKEDQHKQAIEELKKQTGRTQFTQKEIQEQQAIIAKRQQNEAKLVANTQSAMQKFSNLFDKVMGRIFTPERVEGLSNAVESMVPVAEFLADVIVGIGDVISAILSPLESLKKLLNKLFGESEETSSAESGSANEETGAGSALATTAAVGAVGYGAYKIGGAAVNKIKSLRETLPISKAEKLSVIEDKLPSKDTKTGNFMGGLAKGVSAFGNPLVLKGAAIFSISMPLIAAGFAGAMWLLDAANTGESIANIFGPITEIDGSALISAGAGMAAVGAGLGVFAVGNLASTLSGLASAFTGLFVDGPMNQIVNFSNAVNPTALEMSANSISVLGVSIANLSNGLSKIDVSKLEDILEAFEDNPKAAELMLRSSANIAKLENQRPKTQEFYREKVVDKEKSKIDNDELINNKTLLEILKKIEKLVDVNTNQLTEQIVLNRNIKKSDINI